MRPLDAETCRRTGRSGLWWRIGRQFGTCGSSNDIAIPYIHVFSLTKNSDVYKQTFQRRAEPFTTLYVSFSVCQVFKCFSQVKEVYGTGLYAPHLIFNMDEVAFELSSSRALEECGELRLVAIQRMAKLYHRQMSTSHLWLASASTLRQFLH